MKKALSDEDLMQLYTKGDYTAFKELYGRYSGKIYGYLTRRLQGETQREEVFQNIFLKLHKQRSKFNPKFSFKSWIFSISYSCLIDYLRKHSKEKDWQMLREDDLVSEPSNESHSSLLVSEEFEKLDIQQKQILILRYAKDLSFAEISTKPSLRAALMMSSCPELTTSAILSASVKRPTPSTGFLDTCLMNFCQGS